MRGRIATGVAGLLLTLAVVPLAQAAPAWQAPITTALVRGAADPVVAIDETGKAALAYSTNEDTWNGDPRTRLLMRAPGSPFFDGSAAGSTEPALAVNRSGALVTAGADAESGIDVYLSPAPGPPAREPKPPSFGRSLQLRMPYQPQHVDVAIDGAGRATLVWRSPSNIVPDGPAVRVFTATVEPGGEIGPVRELVAANECWPTVQANERGDTLVFADCAGVDDDLFVRPAGGGFGPGEGGGPFAGSLPLLGPTGAALDGAGRVIAYKTNNLAVTGKDRLPRYQNHYAIRRVDGGWELARPFPDITSLDSLADIEAQEDGRAVAVWATAAGIGYAIQASGGDFGTRQLIPHAHGPVGARGLSVAVAPRGPAVVSWRERVSRATLDRDERVFAAIVGADGAASRPRAVSVKGRLPAPDNQPLSFAINGRGLAIGAWEQQCGPGRQFAVMTVVFDERRGTSEPPCQDTVAPKVAVRPQRAQLVGRKLRVRIGCDEACRIVVRARVLRGGKGRPLATAKTRRGVSIGARRYRTFALRLTAGQATKVRSALVTRRRISVRLALSVRDGFDNGAVRRVAVPLRG
jgi:hypothetical protein